LGQTAPNPVMSTLRAFRQEYLALLPNNGEIAGGGKEVKA
jgi:NADH:ubiquinone oxidoreductase subunit F (NADH-binding)